MSTHVHLVGSVALDTAQDVFSTAGKLLGPYLERIPDGEPGGRRLWISWQIPLLRANSAGEARTSYRDFLAARQHGDIRERVRFHAELTS